MSSTEPLEPFESAQIVLPCADLSQDLSFFMQTLGFRLEAIHPADDPSVAVISGYGVRLRLQRGSTGAPGVLRLLCRDPAAAFAGATVLTAPNGTRIELALWDPPLVVPTMRPSFVLTRLRGVTPWVDGRAGMTYRDLIPDRQGGRFIASHIQIREGGAVPDYVHFHKVRFQMIYCWKGWVRVVYEDQGPSFVMQEGDCVLQPPRIRHRVLECSAGLEVIEISSPADHETLAEHALSLPTPTVGSDRDFHGQRFVRHQIAAATWHPLPDHEFEARDLGIERATGGIAEAAVVRACGGRHMSPSSHRGELLFMVLLEGDATLALEGGSSEHVGSGDAIVIPPERRFAIRECSPTFEMLEVKLPSSSDFSHAAWVDRG